MKSESLLKASILSHGINFSHRALNLAKAHNAKGQNGCYNLPGVKDTFSRPQELFLTNRTDGYVTVVSCVASHEYRSPYVLDADDENFFILFEGKRGFDDVRIDVVREPKYYKHMLSNGLLAKEYVSACGYDELNILPWTGCSISHHCAFCGIEKGSTLRRGYKKISSHEISMNKELWENIEVDYLRYLKEALTVAKDDEIYTEHLHPIIISGNLSDVLLDYEATIYSKIAKGTYDVIVDKMTEGIIAVMEPPPSDEMLHRMFESHISTVVFNLEIGSEPWATKYCPGKNIMKKDYIMDLLEAALPVFGSQHVWTNFVFGLEPTGNLILRCAELARAGIVASANVFHIDLGSRLNKFKPPTVSQIIYFFNKLSEIYYKNDMKPFYCEKALRTSLSNEAYAGRLTDAN